MTMAAQATTIPAHVPPELVRDFNLYDFEGATEDVHKAWRRVKEQNPPVFFTPWYGGYWVVTQADLLEEIWPDGEGFSSAKGISVPPAPEGSPPMLPIVTDDPEHKILRKPLTVALSPKAVKELSGAARDLCVQTIEEIKPRGQCDFIADFSLKMPMEVFLRIMNLPVEDRDRLVEMAGIMTKSADPEKRERTLGAMIDYLNIWIERRSKAPGEDLLSRIITMDVDGRELTHHEKLGYLANTMFGGLDTVGGTMGFIAKHLAEHPEQRAMLRDNPAIIPDAIEEFLRRFSIPTITRSLTRDAMIGDVSAKAGDMVMISTMAHGLDEDRWDHAMEVDLSRKPRNHMAFGRGTHVCPGANLARAELRIFIQEWLARIPDFRIRQDVPVRHATGSVAGLVNLPLEWDV